VVSTQQEQIINQAVRALGRDERVYQRGLKLVRVLASEQGEHVIRIIALATLSEKLSSAANWRRQGADGKTSSALPPGWAVKGLYERGQWPGIRPLRGVIDTPVLRVDGTVLHAAGYDAKSGLLLRPTIDFGVIPENPTREHAMAALVELLEVVEDFPFESPAHKAAWVAAVLTPFCMYAITGAIPMVVIDGNVRGAGKGLLADTIGIITTGKPLPAQGHVRDDAEIEKRITALALQGGGPQRIDNVRGGFGGAIWEAAVTTRTWLSRILGTTETVKPPLDIMWVVTGNNIEFLGDMPRRTVPIRLASEEERPEDRMGFKHPNLAAWVQQERPRLVRAALTILRAYFVAGKPEQKGVVFGTFEQWAGVVASALVWLGEPDVCKNRLALEQNENSDSVMLSGLMTAWGEAFGNTPVFLREVLQRIVAEDQRVARRDNDGQHELLALRGAIVELCSRDGKLPPASKVGKTLRHFLMRNVGGRRFLSELDTHSGTHRWRLVRLDGEAIEARGARARRERVG
jgi:hypothetical protein